MTTSYIFWTRASAALLEIAKFDERADTFLYSSCDEYDVVIMRYVICAHKDSTGQGRFTALRIYHYMIEETHITMKSIV